MADAIRTCCGTSTLDECRCPPDGGHTIGPWEVMPANAHHGFYVIGQWGGTICDLYTMSNPSVPSTRNGGESYPIPFQEGSDAANARLIAASPTLLEALERVIADKAPAYHDCIDAGESQCAWCDARAAITLATGKDA